jgi:hypothetical protein
MYFWDSDSSAETVIMICVPCCSLLLNVFLLVYLRVWYLDEDAMAALEPVPQLEYACTWPCQALHCMQAVEIALVFVSSGAMAIRYPCTWDPDNFDDNVIVRVLYMGVAALLVGWSWLLSEETMLTSSAAWIYLIAVPTAITTGSVLASTNYFSDVFGGDNGPTMFQRGTLNTGAAAIALTACLLYTYRASAATDRDESTLSLVLDLQVLVLALMISMAMAYIESYNLAHSYKLRRLTAAAWLCVWPSWCGAAALGHWYVAGPALLCAAMFPLLLGTISLPFLFGLQMVIWGQETFSITNSFIIMEEFDEHSI